MTAADTAERERDASGWGCEVENVEIVRHPARGGTPFRLRIERKVFVGSQGPEGNRIPVMGPSGVGKSTFLNLISGMTYPESAKGEIRWRFPDGRRFSWGSSGPSIEDMATLRRDYFGFAFQNSHLLPYLTVAESLTFGRRNRGESLSGALVRAEKALEHAFGSDDGLKIRILGSYPGELSGGEKQRASLLMALVRDPYVLFADEPTGSLDRDTRKNVMDMLTDWLDEKSDERLLIWVTHHEKDPVDTGSPRRILVRDGGVEFEAVPKQFGAAGP